jgi:hypothetical protein
MPTSTRSSQRSRKDLSEGTLGADFDGNHKTDRLDLFLFLRDGQSAITGGC